MRRKKLIFSFGAIVILAAASSSYFYLGKSDRQPAKRVSQVETKTIGTKTLSAHESGYGTVYSENYVTLKSLQTNRITGIDFKGGERVKKGQVLLTQDSRTAKAQVAQEEAALVQAKNNWQRQLNLRKKGLISQSDYDDSYSTYKQDKALLEQYKVTVSELTIVAPISGVISKTDYHVGDLLEANSTIATLYDPDHLSITYQLPASKRSTYKLGQIVDVVSELNPGKKSEGTVSYIAPNVDTGLITLKATLNKDTDFKPGQYVKVVQQTNLLKDQVIIPTGSLLTSLDGSYAFIVENGKAVMRNVEVGNYYDGYVQILSGLKAGEQVVTNGQNFIHTDEKVVVNNSSTTTSPDAHSGDKK